MVKPKSELPRGILNQKKGKENFELSRFLPSEMLKPFIEHYWIVKWDLKGVGPFRQEVLSHPSVHLVFEKNNTWIWGVVTKKFTRILEGKGEVLGIKFSPAGFYPFYQKPVAGFTNSKIALTEAFDENADELEDQILNKGDEEKIHLTEDFLIRHLPGPDHQMTEVNKMVQEIMERPEIKKVEDLESRFPYTKRTLQRLFRQYVGASPKWVIQRYRLHEAAERIASGNVKSWAELALELGYYDQAHFIRDFKAIVGKSPKEYGSGF